MSWYTLVLYSFLLKNNILLSRHNLDNKFTHLSGNRHLGCLYILVIMSSIAMNINVQVFVWTCFHFSWIYSLYICIYHMVTMFNHLGTCWTLFQHSHTLYILISSVLRGVFSNFCAFSPTLVIVCILNPFGENDVVSHCGFAFPE